jgi:exonuclease VII small subunit
MSSEMKLVPIEPTTEMLSAGADAYTDYVAFETIGDKIRRVFKRMLSASPQPPAPAGEVVAFQQRVQPWMMVCFGPEISADKLERGDRFLEEALELLQSVDYPRERIASLSSYVWSRPKGEPSQEVGGVMVTLAAFCLAHGLDMHEAGETELARIWTKVEKIRAKQAAKPTGSALPVAVSTPPAPDADAIRRAAPKDIGP